LLLAGALGSAPAPALTLADLAEGGRIVSGNGVVYDGFEIRVKGKLSRDLERYEVVATGSGFAITGEGVAAGRGRKAGRGALRISYDVSTDKAEGLVGGAFGVLPGMTTARSLTVKSALYDGGHKLGKLLAHLGGDFGEIDLGGLASLSVRQRIGLSGGFGGSSVASGFTAVPEPSTSVLVALGLALGAALRRSRV
jgi:hypothetical protein